MILQLDKLVNQWLSGLTFTERKVIEHRLGLKGKTHSIAAIGVVIGVSAKKIKRMEQNALRKLSARCSSPALETFNASLRQLFYLHEGTISDAQLNDILQQAPITGEYCPPAVLRLFFTLEENIVWEEKRKAWHLLTMMHAETDERKRPQPKRDTRIEDSKWSSRIHKAVHEDNRQNKKGLDVFQKEFLPLADDSTPIEALNLSHRTHGTLSRAQIKTVGQLASLSARQIWKLRNVGKKTIQEIESKLEEYLARRPSPPASPDAAHAGSALPLALSPPTLARIEAAPLDKISIHRLGLSLFADKRLFQRDIRTLSDLLQHPETFAVNRTIRKRLNHYLEWLGKQEKEVWAREAADQGPSPIFCLIFTDTSLEQLIDEWLEYLPDREQKIMRWRFGLQDKPLTLRQIGTRLDVTRERVRQLATKAIKTLERHRYQGTIEPFLKLLYGELVLAEGLLTTRELKEKASESIEIGNVHFEGVLELLLTIQSRLVKIKKGVWGLSDFPIALIPKINTQLIAILAAEGGSLTADVLLERFKKVPWYHHHQKELPDPFLLACLRLHEKVVQKDGKYKLKEWKQSITKRIVWALRQLEEPAHYTEIARVMNASSSPHQIAPGTVLSYLGRHSELFVWVRLKGVYGLKEWGLERPPSYVEAVAQILEEADTPLMLAEILERFPEIRPYYKESSVRLVLEMQEQFQSFAHDTFGLAEWTNKKTPNGNDNQP